MRKTSLNKWHHKNGGKMISYVGWNMPVEYETGLFAEHKFTREKASLFDVSHMGEFRFKGPEALATLDYLSPTNISKLNEGESCYSFFPNENGGVIDDLLIYCCVKGLDYLICVNALNTEKIHEHINKFAPRFKVSIENECEIWAQIAIQGPKAMEMTNRVIPGVSLLKKFDFLSFNFRGETVWVSRTGYTGEDGFEIFIPPVKSEELWVLFLGEGARPCGLGARDTLRLEAALNLYGNELSDNCNPFERRMGWTVDFSKPNFLAKDKLIDFKEKATRSLIGLKVLGKAIPRAGYNVLVDDEVVGVVTSGTMSPTLGAPIAMVWIDKAAARGEKQLKVQIRNNQVDAVAVSLPFLKKN